jgi:hypothetical protein
MHKHPFLITALVIAAKHGASLRLAVELSHQVASLDELQRIYDRPTLDIGPVNSSILERNTLRIGEVFELL